MIQTPAKEEWTLSAEELTDGVASCPSCGDPLFIDQRDGVVLTLCTCGFHTPTETVANMPAEWVAEALASELEEAVREHALLLTEEQTAELQEVGHQLLTIMDDGATDTVGLMRIRKSLEEGELDVDYAPALAAAIAEIMRSKE